ncbi:MAG: TRAP transporter substrate-binding protein DctP [Pseudorhodobacter sp.]
MTLYAKLKMTCAAALFATSGFASGAIAADLVLPSEVAATHWKTGYMNEFAEKVAERTNDELEVKVFPAGMLYSEQDALAALGTGAVHMVWPVTVRLETIAPATGFLTLPFATNDEMTANTCFLDGITELLSSQVEPANFKVLGLLRASDQLFIFKDREVDKMEDLENTKVRVTGGRILLNMMESLGISGVSMPASEMGTALSQGAIDGIITSPAGWSEMIGMTGNNAFRVPGFSMTIYAIVVDKPWFEGLPEEQQSAISTTVDEIVERQWVEARETDDQIVKKMQEEGANVVFADDAEKARWIDRASGDNDSFREQYPDAMQAFDDIKVKCGV